MKADHDLPVAGSVKARGGIYNVLCFAESLCLKHGLIRFSDNYRKMASPEIRALFGKYSVSVGSTGNLGLSIGTIAAALGFKARVHMSADAKEWKKQLLRSRGVEVIEYAGDYSSAVAQGRKEAVEIFNDNGYRVVRAKCCDMFPWTVHVETVVELSRQ